MIPARGDADADVSLDANCLADALNAYPRPDPEVAAGLDTFLADPNAPATRPAAIEQILRDWLIGHGYIQHRSAGDPYH